MCLTLHCGGSRVLGWDVGWRWSSLASQVRERGGPPGLLAGAIDCAFGRSTLQDSEMYLGFCLAERSAGFLLLLGVPVRP